MNDQNEKRQDKAIKGVQLSAPVDAKQLAVAEAELGIKSEDLASLYLHLEQR